MIILQFAVSFVVLAPLPSARADDTPSYPANAKNTEKSPDQPLAPDEALKLMHVPDGFHATLFAAEPFVAQPISISFDARGRLWVAECYSYESSHGPWNQPIKDRILIFEDTDHDGKFDKRTVFTDDVQYVTSVLPGMGGVWVTATPKLLFIPDKDGDDKPDGEPVVVLDGWNNGKIGHCVVNGLTWGPDGWLWGRQGIQGDSLVGAPGTPENQRTKFNGGIWRYHPTRKVFEIVCTGTTNPWGLDFDAYGQAFFTNCVIGHLWHLIPGAHYKRMYGSDYTPNTYGLIDQCADHLHWQAAKWSDSRTGQEKLGGGHSHAGAMIYLGDNWPEAYRGKIFMNNIHGHRVNMDVLEHVGSGYVGHHGADFMITDDVWFKGISLIYGPDGGVYIADWSDIGECHDTDSVHRFSGRIFKITYGKPSDVPAGMDLAKMSDAELVKLHTHKNEWYARTARRVLQERAVAGADMSAAHAPLRGMLGDSDATHRLRAMWTLYATGGLDDAALVKLLGDASEHVRHWAVRLIVDDGEASDAAIAAFGDMAKNDKSQLVRLGIASAMQRIPVDKRMDIAVGLVGHAEDADDHNLPLMYWYGIEPIVGGDKTKAAMLLGKTKIPLIRTYIARRLAG
ncbi:MAG: hypothetical protein GC159_09565 [Phycisphaera sp.]|nr:hypothetical protein [Phycisphaera sp.]